MLHSGKTLGGTSKCYRSVHEILNCWKLWQGSINGAAYTRELNAQYDSWSTSLLETSEASVGWNWQGIWNYMKKVLLCFCFFTFFQLVFDLIISQKHSPLLIVDRRPKGLSQSLLTTDFKVRYKCPTQTPCMEVHNNTAIVEAIVGFTGMKHFKDLNGGTPNCVPITPLASLTICFQFKNLHLNCAFADAQQQSSILISCGISNPSGGSTHKLVDTNNISCAFKF